VPADELRALNEQYNADAEPLFKRALSIDEKARGPNHPVVAIDLGNLAALYHKQGHYAEAEPLLQALVGDTRKDVRP